MRVLVVDDEQRLAAALRRALEAEGIAVDVAHTGTDGLWLARENDYDVLVLDIMMPGMSGYTLCRTLRDEEDWTPILMLTAKDGDWDQIEALDTGADDRSRASSWIATTSSSSAADPTTRWWSSRCGLATADSPRTSRRAAPMGRPFSRFHNVRQRQWWRWGELNPRPSLRTCAFSGRIP